MNPGPDLRTLIERPPFAGDRPRQLRLPRLTPGHGQQPVYPDPAPLATLAHARPMSIVIADSDLAAACERIRALGGYVGTLGPVPRHNALWRLSIYWPANQP